MGVSRNGKNWQVKINKGDFKKYIGTFKTEKEAAVTHDFYRILTEKNDAKTNFSYDVQLIELMVLNFNRETQYFNPRPFIKYVQ